MYIGGNASDVVVGGNQTDFSIVPTGTISANGQFGVAIVGTAHDVQVNFSYIGTDSRGLIPTTGGPMALGNQQGGVLIGAGTSSVTIGSTNPALHTVISGNHGDGIEINGATDNTVADCLIGVEKDGQTAMPNSGNGVYIVNSSNTLLGGLGADAANGSNVISGNGANGVAIDDSSNTTLIDNFIGTDATGTIAVGNGGNGVLLTNGAYYNTIGGTASAEPLGATPPEFTGARPPEGNVISGNGGDGVLLTNGATNNILEGNFIGTNVMGVTALGNAGDGVGIVNAPANSLLGTTVNQNPFIYYNVVSGNLGNGLVINDSNDTVIQADFFGIGSDNKTPVGNGLNGVVVEGSSDSTTFGGVIPLGSVVAANHLNGVVVQDTASDFLSFNTFAGIGAFVNYTDLGNGQDGFLITSTGTGNVLRTNLISRNGANGVEIGQNASGVQVVQNVIGLDIQGTIALPNVGNGVKIDGTAHDNVIGGPQPTYSIAPRNVISANGGYGVAIVGSAYDNQVNFSFIGTDVYGENAIGTDNSVLGNAQGGIYLGPGTSGTTVGSTDPTLPTLISGNLGNGIEMNGATGNTVIGCLFGVEKDGQSPLLTGGNSGNAIYIVNSSNNVIGGTQPGDGNLITLYPGNGVLVSSGSGNGIRGNSIFGNTLAGIYLAPAPTTTRPPRS